MSAKTIMVIEDDKDIRETIKEFLEMEGYNVLTADNGKVALELLHDQPAPCLIFLDLLMPVMGGREFLNELKSDTVLAPIPVYIVSSNINGSNTQGSVGYVKKPADLNLLLSIVKTYC